MNKKIEEQKKQLEGGKEVDGMMKKMGLKIKI